LIDSGGPVTDAGRTRRVLAVWQGAADRALAHLRVLGLDRVERDVSLADWARQQAAQERE
jgi:hypothetical protein